MSYICCSMLTIFVIFRLRASPVVCVFTSSANAFDVTDKRFSVKQSYTHSAIVAYDSCKYAITLQTGLFSISQSTHNCRNSHHC